MNTPNKLILAGLLLALALLGAGCAASQDASMARSRGLINQGIIVPAEEIRVAEYVNYFEQRFPEPVQGQVALDLRLGNPQVPATGGDVWLQLGLQGRSAETTDIAPMNLALVIDKSGSMDTPDKMPYVKQSLRTFFESLRPDDIVALVAYDDEAEVILPAQPVGDGSWILGAIERLVPSGSTNLHAGMMLGFAEVDKHFDIRRNNRVILLTDGIANRGVTDDQLIASDALAYNQRGIYLSTVGLGTSFNDQLLSTLARQGHGNYNFIDSAQEMDKVFRQEASGLLEKLAENVTVAIRPAAGVRLAQVTGFEGALPAEGVQVQVQDMSTGNSQVLLVRLAVDPGAGGVRPLADVTLTFDDLIAQRPASVSGQATVAAVATGPYDPLSDVEVLRNVTIQRAAEGLRSISWMVRSENYADSLQLARDLEQQLRTVAALTADEQMVQTADLFRRYQVTLEEGLRGQQAQRAAPTPEQTFASPVQTQRWGPSAPTPTPALPVIEVQ